MCLATMLRCFALLFIFSGVNKVLCLQSSCKAEQKPAAQQGAAGCGCENLKRAAAAVDRVEDRSGSGDPAVKYSRGANERTSEAQEEDKKLQSQVRCYLCCVNTNQFPSQFVSSLTSPKFTIPLKRSTSFQSNFTT